MNSNGKCTQYADNGWAAMLYNKDYVTVQKKVTIRG